MWGLTHARHHRWPFGPTQAIVFGEALSASLAQQDMPSADVTFINASLATTYATRRRLLQGEPLADF